jgi:hypothetical protein
VWSLFFQKVVDSEKVMHGLKKSKRLDQAAKDKIETVCILYFFSPLPKRFRDPD